MLLLEPDIPESKLLRQALATSTDHTVVLPNVPLPYPDWVTAKSMTIDDIMESATPGLYRASVIVKGTISTIVVDMCRGGHRLVKCDNSSWYCKTCDTSPQETFHG